MSSGGRARILCLNPFPTAIFEELMQALSSYQPEEISLHQIFRTRGSFDLPPLPETSTIFITWGFGSYVLSNWIQKEINSSAVLLLEPDDFYQGYYREEALKAFQKLSSRDLASYLIQFFNWSFQPSLLKDRLIQSILPEANYYKALFLHIKTLPISAEFAHLPLTLVRTGKTKEKINQVHAASPFFLRGNTKLLSWPNQDPLCLNQKTIPALALEIAGLQSLIFKTPQDTGE